jgi:hypothetical protein
MSIRIHQATDVASRRFAQVAFAQTKREKEDQDNDPNVMKVFEEQENGVLLPLPPLPPLH